MKKLFESIEVLDYIIIDMFPLVDKFNDKYSQKFTSA